MSIPATSHAAAPREAVVTRALPVSLPPLWPRMHKLARLETARRTRLLPPLGATTEAGMNMRAPLSRGLKEGERRARSITGAAALPFPMGTGAQSSAQRRRDTCSLSGLTPPTTAQQGCWQGSPFSPPFTGVPPPGLRSPVGSVLFRWTLLTCKRLSKVANHINIQGINMVQRQ